jgi:adenosylmethionine---8-amino-7-oxononanoate aminotransferase
VTWGLVVTGTDTGVGKTIASALCLALAARKNPDRPRRYWKPVQTGWPQDDDAATVARLARLEPDEVITGAVRLAMPASPLEAALAEGVRPAPPWTLPPVSADTMLVVEGAGGLLVPFNETVLMADLFAAWKLPLVVVARPDVGTLNHTLLTLAEARRRGLVVWQVWFSRPPTAAVRDAVRRLGNAAVVVLPEISDFDRDFDRALAELDDREAQSFDDAKVQSQESASQLHDISGSSHRVLHPKRVADCHGTARNFPDSVRRDAASVWHPYTQHGLGREPLPVIAADGAWLTLADDRRVLDGISSWWTTLHGHGHPAIVDAIAVQCKRLDHVQFGGATHEPAVALAERLLRIAPPGLERVFYSDDGSTAVETALKMAVAFHARRGEPERTRIVALEGGYHGDTAGAMSVSADSVFTRDFRSLRFDVLRAPPPVRRRADGPCVEALSDLLDRERGTVAAIIVEPLILAAGGMLVYGEAYLRALRGLATRHGALLIADEVFTGFGRTGAMFACERAGLSPDLLCVSKALTGGTLALAATLATSSIFSAFLSDRTEDAFLHGHSYTANPIACAAALASLDLLDAAALDRATVIGERLEAGLAALRTNPRVKDIRGLGPMRAVEVDVDADGPGERGYLASAGRRMADAALARGVFLRPLGDVLYAMPPLCTTDAEVDQIADAIVAGVSAL